MLDELVTTGGEYKGKHHGDFFQTPEAIADRMAKELKLQPGDRVLEPQAGHGRLARAAADALAQVICIEIDPERCQVLRAAGFQVVEGDFPPAGRLRHGDRAVPHQASSPIRRFRSSRMRCTCSR